MLNREDFVPVTFENKHLIENYCAQYPQYHSEASTVTILSWENYAAYRIAEYKNHLFIECRTAEEEGIHTPIGTPDPEILKELLTFARKENLTVEIYDDVMLKAIEEYYPQIPITENRNYFEYCYSTEELATLKGKKYLNIRGQINTFNARWKYRVEKICAENMDEVKALLTEWAKTKNSETHAILKEEVNAARFTLDNFEKLPVDGIIIRILENNKAAGLAVWEIQNKDSVLIHFEKGLAEYPGIYKVINRETALELKGKAAWINRESDMGEAGLREAKLRYHPEFFVKAYFIPPKDIPETLI